LNLNTKFIKKLNKTVLKTIQPRDGRYFATDEPVTLFDIKLFEFIQSNDNYQILQEAGMVKYIVKIIEKIKRVKNN